MAVSTCVVSGTTISPSGQGILNVTVTARQNRPVKYDATNLILPSVVETTTTTNSSGAWSLTLVETASTGITYTVSFEFPAGSSTYQRYEYTISVPNQATANFADLIGTQV